MPLFSAFAPLGMLAFSSKPTHAESLYRAMAAALKGGISQEPGTPDEAETYADAMCLAAAQYTLERAGNSADPLLASPELLPLLEKDYGVRKGPYDSLTLRRQRLAALQRLPDGAAYLAIWNALSALLGADFLAYRVLTPSETTVYPATPTSSTELNCVRADVPAVYARLIDPVTLTGSPTWVTYGPIDPNAFPVRLLKGDVVMVSPENTAQAERVTIAEVREVDGVRQFLATFTKAHDLNAAVTTVDWPYWWSTQRYAFVIVTATAALDPEKRRQIDEVMAKMARGVSQWAIVQPTTPGATTVGPLTLPVSLGSVPIGSYSFSTLP
jgi:hypothetical protein